MTTPMTSLTGVITAGRGGFVSRCDALDLGVAAVRLGAGRATKEEAIDPGVGFTVCVKVGDEVAAGDPLIRVRWRRPERLAAAQPLVERAVVIGDDPVAALPLILEEVR